MKARPPTVRTRFLIIVAALSVGLMSAAFAAKPASITIAGLDRKEGHDPAKMAKGIPRDFPLPAGSHDLVANSTLDIGSVAGIGADQVAPFYLPFFRRAHWDVIRNTQVPGFVMLTACQHSGERCVKLSASSGGMSDKDNVMRFGFPKKSDLH